MRKLLAVMAAAAALAFGGSAQALEWEGFYAGAQAGYAWNDMESDYYSSDDSSDLDGWMAGGFVGAQWSSDGPWRFAIEADANWHEDSDDSDYDYEEYYYGGVDINWTANLRGVASYEVSDNTQIYAAAGVAFANVDVNYCNYCIGDDSNDETLTGWTVAAGVQHDYSDRFFSRLEVRYSDYGDIDDDYYYEGADASLTSTAVLIGVGWRFGE